MPDRATVLQTQGIRADQEISPRIDSLCTKALNRFVEVAKPVGILSRISPDDFELVYRGEGRNEPHAPMGGIFCRAEHLALFVVTLGGGVSLEIQERFKANDFALGSMLDSVASAAADRMAEVAQHRFLEMLEGCGQSTSATHVLRYSPGYCGWHISSQRKLFEFLRPERIGISLRESFLMEPLKSVSGVVIAGPAEIHGMRQGE